MSLTGRFAAFAMSMLVALSVGWSTPAAAQNTTGEYRGALDAINLEMRSLWGEIDRFKVEARYCRPPPPSKAQAQAEMAALESRVAALNRRYQAMRQSLLGFLDRNHRLYSELMVNNVDPRDRHWWTRYENSRKKMLDELARKKAALAAAPEINCAQPTQRPAVTTGQPPGQLPKQPQSSLPQRPTYAPLNWPPFPTHFCSWDEYWKFVHQLNLLVEQVAENGKRAATFRADVERAINAYVQNDRPVPPPLLALRRPANADFEEQNRQLREADARVRRAKAILVIDCRSPAQADPPRTEPPPTTPGPKFQTGSVLDDIRNRAWAQVEAMKAAYGRCDPDSYERALRELEKLVDEARLARGAARGAGEFSTFDPKEAEGLVEALLPVIEARRWLLLDLKRKCKVPTRTQPPATPSQTGFIPPTDRRMAIILEEHNKARAEVGSPPLIWDPALAAGAAAYAQQLTTLGHASREGRKDIRENLLQSLPGGRSPKQMVGVWIAERRYFRPGIFPNVSTTGNWVDVGHYTQMIWPTTTRLGCAIHSGAKFDWTVCRYSPPGNRDGSPILASYPPAIPDLPRMKVGGGMTQIDPPAPPPPPPPTATDPAPTGDEAQHPLRTYFTDAMLRYDDAWLKCDREAMARALAEMRYAIDELKKRRKAAKAAGRFSTVNPDEVQKSIDLFERTLRQQEQRPMRTCPLPPPPPRSERG